MSEEIYGVSVDKIPTLVRQLEDADESWEKMQPLDEFGVDWGDRHALLWELMRRGEYTAWDDPIVWGELASESGMKAASAQDIVDFLGKVTSFDKERGGGGGHDDYYDEGEYYDDMGYDDMGYDEFGGMGGYSKPPFESPRLAQFWPLHLDAMAMHAYAEDRELVEGAAESFSEDIQRGLQLVRRRFGVLEREEVADKVVTSLASVEVWGGLPGPIWDWDDGELVALKNNYGGEEGETAKQRFVEQFADGPTWGRAILEALGEERDRQPLFDNMLPAWPVADSEELAGLLEHVAFHGDGPDKVYEAMAQRDDEPQLLMEIAQSLVEENKKRNAEVVAICAVLSARRRDEPAPPSALEMIDFDALGSTSQRKAPAGLDALVQALRAAGEEKGVARLIEVFDGQYTKRKPFVAICAFPENEALLTKAFKVTEEMATGDYGNFSNMDAPVLGLSLVGPSLLDRLVQEFESAEAPVVRDTCRRAILGILADTDEPIDPKYDAFISLVDLEDEQIRDSDLSYRLVPDYLAVLKAMPEQRAIELILGDLDESSPTWPRAIAALKEFQNPGLFDKLFGLIAAGHSTKVGSHDWFGEIRGIYYQHQEAIKPHLGPVLANNDDTDLHNTIRGMVGAEVYDELLAAAGAESVADTNQAAKIRRLSNAYFEAVPDAARRTIYIFERGDEPPEEGTLNRIGGRPFGADDSNWPSKNGDKDLPMTHMFTLDLKTTPGIAGVFKEGVRAVSLFVRSPGGNEAWTPHNADSEVMVLSDDEIEEFEGELPVGDDQARAFSVEEVEVPGEAFFVQYGTNPALEEIKNAVYQARAWGGAPVPIWLQGDEYAGTFLLQFDEGFVYMNLGDCGVMYVFADTAFWQCH